MFHNGLPSKVTGRQKRHTVVSLFSTPPSRLGKTHMLWRTCAWHLGFSPALAHATLFLTAFLSLLFLSLTHSQHTLTHNTHTLSLTHSQHSLTHSQHSLEIMELSPLLSQAQKAAASKFANTIKGGRYVVTGGTGFVGQRLVEMLVERGADRVISFDIVPP